ncbi:hypothetical protein PL9214290764 [Planktothrix tepida PCC 9214]|uniref:Transposase n=1 Tax=Planktothrix tepida PCC 9214 TaxID=671072 RepID=A0A1J1LF29_9CYAN|nr:hypothetical protein [Planktothrix tepida]CUR31173.1 hypothetical protein PL9214290764 [Planktothrix tepida PCC 9214]
MNNQLHITPEVIWEKVHSELQSHPEACLVFDNTVLDKRFSSDEVISECKLRWKIEEFHREIKQLTGLKQK